MTIIRNALDLQSAPMADLIETYNAMSEKPVKRFADITTARRRTEMALLAAADAAGHAGVAPNTKPKPETVAEIAARSPRIAKERVQDATNDAAEVPSPQTPEKPQPATFGSLAKKLLSEADRSVRPVARDPSQLPEPRVRLTHVVVAGPGEARLNPNSMRKAVFDWISAEGKNGKPVAIADLNTHFDGEMRGQVQKLTASKHLRPATPEEIVKILAIALAKVAK